jgi:hypothetical protein
MALSDHKDPQAWTALTEHKVQKETKVILAIQDHKDPQD